MNVKKGDLAFITGNVCPENIGAVVEVIEYAGFHLWYGHMWLVRPSRPLRTERGVYMPEGVCDDRDLRPITPPGLTEEVTEEREVTA